MNILVIGGCGYVGTMLTMDLLEKKHNIMVLDTQWFGNYLPEKNPKLKILKRDIRDMTRKNAPLIPAADSYLICTDFSDKEVTFNTIIKIIKKK